MPASAVLTPPAIPGGDWTAVTTNTDGDPCKIVVNPGIGGAEPDCRCVTISCPCECTLVRTPSYKPDGSIDHVDVDCFCQGS